MMKKKKYLFILVLSLLFSACSNQITPTDPSPVDPVIEPEEHFHTFSNEWSHDDVYHWHEATCEHKDEKSEISKHEFSSPVTIKEATFDEEGLLMETCSICQYEKYTPIPVLESTLTVDIYASNDFHGYVEESYSNLGLKKFATYFKEMGEKDNTLLIDQGDTWQGSIYSNYNYGNLITDVMSYAHFDARTVGNHDFDWGIDKLVVNTNRSYNDYTVPVLAANVYDYDFDNKTPLETHRDDIGRKSISYTLENGLKVGIVGVIGSNQLSSIMSTYVRDICFINHINVIKEEATKLREEGCQIVIASCHAGQDELLGNQLNKYVDLVLCAHTHRVEDSKEGDLRFVQFGRNGENFGHVSLTLDLKTNKVSTTFKTLTTSYISNQVSKIDPVIESLVNQSNAECEEIGNLVVASNATYFSKSEHAVNLMCEAMYEKATSENYDVVLSYCNTARAYLPSGSWTYADLYNAFPFDNKVVIASIKGSDMLREIKQWNNVYYNPNFDHLIDRNEYYTIACIDYLLYHTDENRNYDYFYSFNGEIIGEIEDNYRFILRDYLLSKGYDKGKYLSSDNYSSSLSSFNKELLTENN